MNLTKDPKNPERLKADLDTIQRDHNLLQGIVQLQAAQIAALQAVTTPGDPIIAPTGRVTTFKQRNSEPNSPFGGGVVVDRASGLAGQGTTSDPLRATIDTASLLFTASGQLSGVIRLYQIPSAAVSANFFNRNTTPLELVAAQSGVSHIPLYCAIYSLMLDSTSGGGVNYTNGATGWKVESNNPASTTLPWMSLTNLSLTAPAGAGNTLRGYSSAVGTFTTNNVGNTAFKHKGQPLRLMSDSNVSGGGGGTMGLTLIYLDTTNDLY